MGIRGARAGSCASCHPWVFTRGAVAFERPASASWAMYARDRQRADGISYGAVMGQTPHTDRAERGLSLQSMGCSFLLTCKQRAWICWLLTAAEGSASLGPTKPVPGMCKSHKAGCGSSWSSSDSQDLA